MQSVLVCGGVAGLAVEISNPAGCLFFPLLFVETKLERKLVMEGA
jgi:hypothetical protein